MKKILFREENNNETDLKLYCSGLEDVWGKNQKQPNRQTNRRRADYSR